MHVVVDPGSEDAPLCQTSTVRSEEGRALGGVIQGQDSSPFPVGGARFSA